MGAISEFVATFRRDLPMYLAIKEEVDKLCEEALRGKQILWQSRVKDPESLEKKFSDRISNYDDESKNVADVKDLVGGRFVLAYWTDFQYVEDEVKKKFNIKSQTHHPKHELNAISFQRRFRGYDGLHLYVKLPGDKNRQSCDPIIELQVMSGFMWTFMTLEHNIVYKTLNGIPDKDMLSDLESFKGIANLGELAMEKCDKKMTPIAQTQMASQQNFIGSDLQAKIRAVVAEVKLDEKDNKCLGDLLQTDPLHDRTEIERKWGAVLEGSCSWIIEDPAFVSWWDLEDSRFLWIHGDPGKGKTMMMIFLISEVSKRLDDLPGANVLAYFFCQNANDRRNTAVSVLRGLIYLIIDQEKTLVSHIRKKYDIPGRRLFEDENAMSALQELLVDILTDQSLHSVYFMVDALDECDSTVLELLKWIMSPDSRIPQKIKWLTTSRNDPAFIERLGGGDQLHTSLELNSSHVAHAVANFINHRVAELKSYSSEQQASVRESLLEKAEGTFLWVALICKELTGADVRPGKVESWLGTIPAELMRIYERMLYQLLHQRDDEDIEVCRRILRAVILAFRPLSLEEIAFLVEAKDKENVRELIGYCASFITIHENIVYLIHQSAKDFLSDPGRKDILPSGEEHEHAITASLCLDNLWSTLKPDICDLKMPGVCIVDIDRSTIEEHLPLPAQYACLYWVAHFSHSGPHEQNLLLRRPLIFYGFFQHHFLHWLEAFSLLGGIALAVSAINTLCITPTLRMDLNLDYFVNDARRFIIEFQYIIERAPLQVHNSALVFSPRDSFIRKVFSSFMPAWIKILPTVDKYWSNSLQSLESLSSSIAFSHNGRLLASGSYDNSVRLWDSATGSFLGTLEGHSSAVNAVNFSFTGQLASASDDKSIKLWNPKTRKSQGTLTGHSATVTEIRFFPSGQVLASASSDGIMKIWDINERTCQATLETFSGPSHKYPVMNIAPNGRILAFISPHKSISLYNPDSGVLPYLLEGDQSEAHRNRSPRKVVISPNGQWLASGSHESCVMLWHLTTGRRSPTIIRGEDVPLEALIFSPDSYLLTTLSRGGELKIWTLAGHLQCDLRRALTGPSLKITEVIFSPNGRLLAATSLDPTIRLWEIHTRTRGTLRGHSAQISQIAFSPDSRLLASASQDQTIKFWDPLVQFSRGALQNRLGSRFSGGVGDSHTESVIAIACSPDGQLVASGSLDYDIKLWSSEGVLEDTLDKYKGRILGLALSTRGILLAAASDDASVRIWNLHEDTCEKPFKHDGTLKVMTFSANRRLLACGESDAITLWDPIKLCYRGRLGSHPRPIFGMTISPDGELLAAAYTNNTIRLWNIEFEDLVMKIDLQPGQNLSIKLDGSYINASINPHYSLNPEYCLQMDGNSFQMSLSLENTPQMHGIAGSSYAVGFNNAWVTYRGRRVVWLPTKYRPLKLPGRPTIYASNNNTLALGGDSGKVTLFRFRTTNSPF